MSVDLVLGFLILTSGFGNVVYRSVKATTKPDNFYKDKSTEYIVGSIAASLVAAAIAAAFMAYGLTLIVRNWPQ